MSVISLISFMICITIILISLRSESDVFSPGRVFAFVWAMVIGLTDLKFSWLQKEWDAITWMQVLIGPVAFLIGTFIIFVILINKQLKSVKEIRIEGELFQFNPDKLFNAILILFALFTLSYFVIYMKTGEIPLFSSKPGVARANFTMFGLGLFLHNVVLIVFFSAVYIISQKRNRKNKFILILLSFISTSLYVITLQRYQIFLTILMILILLYYTTFKIKVKTVFISAIVIVVFFYLVSSFRAGEIIIFVLYRLSKMKFSPSYAVFTEPYMYVAMNLENFARSINKIDHFTYGYYTFDFLTAITGIKHWISEYFSLNETPYLISGYNTYSAFWNYYRDFGILGVFFIPLFGGMIMSFLYYSIRMRPTLKKIAVYAMLMFAVIFSFFNSAFGFLWFVFDLVILSILFKYIGGDKQLTRTFQ